MSEPLPEYEQLPFPPGEAPFRIKGVAYRGHMEYVASRVPGGVAAQREGFVSEALKQFFDQPFMAASWYDVFPIVSAGYVCAKLCGTSFETFVRMRSRYQAEQDIHGVYKLMLKLASPEAVGLRLPRLTAQYFDFGATESRTIGHNRIEAVRTGTPEPMATWYAFIAETYIQYALELAGAKNTRVVTHPAKREGTKHGVALVTMSMEAEWT